MDDPAIIMLFVQMQNVLFFLAVPPEVKKIDETVRLKTGDTHSIQIPFSAYPMPKVSWKFKGGKLPDPRRFTEETIIGLITLRLSKVQRTDSGDYTLHVENEFGSTSCKVKVIVTGKHKLFYSSSC